MGNKSRSQPRKCSSKHNDDSQAPQQEKRNAFKSYCEWNCKGSIIKIVFHVKPPTVGGRSVGVDVLIFALNDFLCAFIFSIGCFFLLVAFQSDYVVAV